VGCLADDVKDPEFLRSYIIESVRVSTIDQMVDDLAEARTRLGLSKAELARAIGPMKSVSRWRSRSVRVRRIPRSWSGRSRVGGPQLSRAILGARRRGHLARGRRAVKAVENHALPAGHADPADAPCRPGGRPRRSG
jgi:hypothetical protein